MRLYEVNGMVLDLEHIVSIGPVETPQHRGRAEFKVHTILGKEIKIEYEEPIRTPDWRNSDEEQRYLKSQEVRDEYVAEAISEAKKKMTESRRKLIEAWREADFSIIEEIARMLGRDTST